MLNLRATFSPEVQETSMLAVSQLPSTIRFNSSIVGNMGAPLRSVFSVELDTEEADPMEDEDTERQDTCADP